MKDQLIESWNIHNRINLYMLDSIDPKALEGRASNKGRDVGELFAHIHNVRIMWLEVAGPELLDGLTKIEKEKAHDKKLLARSIKDSGKAMAALLEKALATGGKVKGFKPHTAAFLAYAISHESHHRGQIALSLKLAANPLDKKIAYGMWEWGVR